MVYLSFGIICAFAAIERPSFSKILLLTPRLKPFPKPGTFSQCTGDVLRRIVHFGKNEILSMNGLRCFLKGTRLRFDAINDGTHIKQSRRFKFI